MYDPAAQYRTMKEEIDETVQMVLGSKGKYRGKEELASFLDEFARYHGSAYAIPAGSGYDSIFKALLACEVGPGDEVITVSNNCIATSAAISHTGGTIIWVDIDERTMNMDTENVEERITERTKVILPVHMYGLPADMEPIAGLAEKYGLLVVEDAALALGAKYKGRLTGTIGDIGCFSHGERKVLGSHFHGGTAITNDPELAERMRNLFIYSESRGKTEVRGNTELHSEFYYPREGYPGTILPVSAAVLRKKIKRVTSWQERKKEIEKVYRDKLVDSEVILPIGSMELSGVFRTFRNYPVRIQNRDRVRRRLASKGIESGIHYSPPLHLQPAYEKINGCKNQLVTTERVCKEILTLPMYPELSDKEVTFIGETLRKIVDSG